MTRSFEVKSYEVRETAGKGSEEHDALTLLYDMICSRVRERKTVSAAIACRRSHENRCSKIRDEYINLKNPRRW